MIMQLSRVLGYQANKSGINAWLDGIRGNFCVPVVRLQQVKGNSLKTSSDKEQWKNRWRFWRMPKSQGCKRVTVWVCICVLLEYCYCCCCYAILPTKYFSLPWNKGSLQSINLISACVFLCTVFCTHYKSTLYRIFLCILMIPVCRGERGRKRERSAVDFHLMLIHQNQVSCEWWRRRACARRRQRPAESLPVAQQPSRRKMDVLPPAPLLAETQYIPGTASSAHAGDGAVVAGGAESLNSWLLCQGGIKRISYHPG